MNEFLQPVDHLPPSLAEPQHHPAQPFAMEHMRRELTNIPPTAAQNLSAGANWAAEFDPAEHARMEAAFGPAKVAAGGPAFSAAEFAQFQQPDMAAHPAAATARTPPMMSSMYGMPRMGFMGGMGGMGLMGSSFGPIMQQNIGSEQQDAKGKGRMVELDDDNWESQFAEMDKADQKGDEEASAAMESELNDIDRSVPGDTEFAEFERTWNEITAAETLRNRQIANANVTFDDMNLGDMGEWEGFDDPVLSTHPTTAGPRVGDYLFEDENPFKAISNPFEEGVKILTEGGNLSLAALAFEAAVLKESGHVRAWTMLGLAQAQNEKETPAIRAMERALKLDPSNLDALMGLAVSYTNEGYDTTAYRTLERWLSVKYPQIIDPSQLSPDTEVSFTDRQILHDKVTDRFIQAAMLSPSGEHMDPDVQVGLGVLFYGAEEYDKAVDCFSAALASTESGISNQRDQVHLLWNRLGATLANSGRSEEAIEAYEKALTLNPNFVRARYNLGVSCINIGCYPEAAQHLLGALAMHRVVEQEGRERARELVDGHIDDNELDKMMHISQNQSTNLYDTLRRVFSQMGRRDLSDMVVSGMDVGVFRNEFDF